MLLRPAQITSWMWAAISDQSPGVGLTAQPRHRLNESGVALPAGSNTTPPRYWRRLG